MEATDAAGIGAGDSVAGSVEKIDVVVGAAADLLGDGLRQLGFNLHINSIHMLHVTFWS